MKITWILYFPRGVNRLKNILLTNCATSVVIAGSPTDMSQPPLSSYGFVNRRYWREVFQKKGTHTLRIFHIRIYGWEGTETYCIHFAIHFCFVNFSVISVLVPISSALFFVLIFFFHVFHAMFFFFRRCRKKIAWKSGQKKARKTRWKKLAEKNA